MGLVEERFAEGVAAFRRGEPRTACPHDSSFDWCCGWDSAQARKQVAFIDYVKHRRLFDKEFIAAHQRGALQMVQELRARRITRMEGEYPDFPEAYLRAR
ncbi:hypothetical protein GURKE_00930 [Brevundimonas phage vB_BpoS-Gurke]|uniref:Uncharacterized protein n=1 Tax=Brevundimonas phage vB_BpoS-Gurke TaxID=2948599 RepID=A0A9E7N4B1_9CAUD|nr:hypothetical protein GURKE_00930 [Brevundimonas phage vB_BpoS-Gurke]